MTNNDDMRQRGWGAQDGQGSSKKDGQEQGPPEYNPPSYDFATGGSAPAGSKAPSQPPFTPGPASPYPVPGPSMHYYQHPGTGHVLTSPLPPDHPEMQCLQAGGHVAGATRWGILGVLAAVLWFPLGIGLCLLDRRVVCRRCGSVLDGGIAC